MSALPVSHEVGQRQHDRLACLGSPCLVQAGARAAGEYRHHGQQHNWPRASRQCPLPPPGQVCLRPHAMASSGERLPGLTLEELQGAPGVAAGMRYLTSDPRCRPSRVGLPDRRLPCDDWHLHVPPAACSPLRLDYPGSMDGNRYRPPYPASCHLIGEAATRKGTATGAGPEDHGPSGQTDKLCGPCLKTARQQQVSRSPRFEFRPSWALTPTSERHALLERTVWHVSHHLIHGLTRP